jgi:hypothetical protein
MLFAEIARSKKPLESLVRLALSTKGVTVTDGTVQRYSSLLEAAILADEGENLDGNAWADFVGGIDGASKFQGVVQAIGSTLGASSSEVEQFLAVTNATIDVMAGETVEQAEAYLEADLAAIVPTEPEAYAHLDADSQAVAIEVDRVMGAADPARPEPSHIADEGAEI